MSASALLNLFNRFERSSGGVARLRQIILDLAVRGKLVEQDAGDEPAWDLLANIAEERRVAIEDKRIKDPKWVTNRHGCCSDTSSPLGWVSVPLHQGLLALQTGPFGSALHKSDYVQKGTPVINPASIKGEKIVPIKGMAIGAETLRRLAVFRLETGDVILGRRGEMGRSAEITEREAGWLCGTGSLVLKLPTCISGKFIVKLLASPSIREYLGGASVGSTMQNLNQKILLGMKIGLPPLAEQKRIVAKVEELIGLCDELEATGAERERQQDRLNAASLHRIAHAPDDDALRAAAKFHFRILPKVTVRPDQIPPLRQTILDLAVRGKLVEQDERDEPASTVVGAIEKTKATLIAEKLIRKPGKLPSLTDEDRNFDAPNGWAWARLGEIYDVRDGTHDSPKYVESGFPLVTSKNLSTGSLTFDGAKLISESDHQKISKRSRVDRDDILFAMIGTIGNPVIVDSDRDFSIKNIALFKYFDRNLVDPLFLLTFLRHVASDMKRDATGGLQPFVSLGFLRSYPTALPPLAEQRRIVAKVDELMALCDELDASLTRTQTESRRLLEAVMAQITTVEG